MKFTAPIAFIFLFLSGCSQMPVKPTSLPTDAQFWAEQSLRRQKLGQVHGKITLRFSGSEKKGFGKGNLFSELAPQQGKLEVKDPMGRMSYVLVSQGTEVSAYYPTEKRLYIDKSGGKKYLSRFLKIPVSFSELQKLVLGLVPLEGKKFERWGWSDEKGKIEAFQRGNQYQIHYWIDPATLSIREAQIQSPQENTLLDFSEFQECCDYGKPNTGNQISVAQSIKIQRVQTGSEVSIEWNDMRTGNHFPSETFKLATPESDVKAITL